MSAKLVSKDGSTGRVGSCVVPNPSPNFDPIPSGGQFFVESVLDDFPPSLKNLVLDFFNSGPGEETQLVSVSYPAVCFFFLPNLLLREGASVSYPLKAKLSPASVPFLVPLDVKLVALCRSTSVFFADSPSSSACSSSSFAPTPLSRPAFFLPALPPLSFSFPFTSFAYPASLS